MEQLTAILLRPGTLALVVMTVAAVFFTRRVLESAFPSLKPEELHTAATRSVAYPTAMSRWYNEVLVYAFPLLWGVVWALWQNEFLFDKFVLFRERLFFALTIAWLSGFLYRIAKRAVPKLFGVDVQEPPVVADQTPSDL